MTQPPTSVIDRDSRGPKKRGNMPERTSEITVFYQAYPSPTISEKVRLDPYRHKY